MIFERPRVSAAAKQGSADSCSSNKLTEWIAIVGSHHIVVEVHYTTPAALEGLLRSKAVDGRYHLGLPERWVGQIRRGDCIPPRLAIAPPSPIS